jgi:hypothetical protein
MKLEEVMVMNKESDIMHVSKIEFIDKETGKNISTEKMDITDVQKMLSEGNEMVLTVGKTKDK